MQTYIQEMISRSSQGHWVTRCFEIPVEGSRIPRLHQTLTCSVCEITKVVDDKKPFPSFFFREPTTARLEAFAHPDSFKHQRHMSGIQRSLQKATLTALPNEIQQHIYYLAHWQTFTEEQTLDMASSLIQVSITVRNNFMESVRAWGEGTERKLVEIIRDAYVMEGRVTTFEKPITCLCLRNLEFVRI